MDSELINILKQERKGIRIKILRTLILCIGLLLIISQYLRAQVINNYGAQVNVTSGIYVTSKDAENNSSGTLLNNGNINLSGYYTNNATTNGNGTLSLGGDWTNTSLFIPGSSTVIFNGSGDQFINRSGGENFFNLSVANSGAPSKYVKMPNDVTVLGTLTMSLGNIDAGTYLLYLNNPLAAALNYTSTTGSRVLGKFERGVSETANYLFPLGTASYYNPANLKPNAISTSGSVLSQFFTSDPGSTGLPLIDSSVPADSVVEVDKEFSYGYWRLTANSLSISDFNINLDAAGFVPDTVRDVTRIIKRLTFGPGSWTLDGSHKNAAGTVVYRNNLTGDIDPGGTDFALGRERPHITVHPKNLIQCEHTNAIFSVTATGAAPFTYRWYKDGTPITNSSDYSGARTATLTVIDINLVDDGNYYCIVSDRYRNPTTSNSASLTVMKIPVATLTNATQPNVCSNIPITNMVLGFSYYDPGSIFEWSRDNPTGITSAIPMSGTYYSIGDFISGAFDNSTNAPVVVTFTIFPKGPAPTACPGNPVTATITVNPHPLATPVNNLPAICYGASTDIVLKTTTQMTQGVIDYDYTITKGSSVTGNTASAVNLAENYHIAYSYQNSSDTIQSVYYHIMPKNTASGCLPGDTVVAEVKIHPKPLRKMYLSKPFTCEGGANGIMTAILSKGSKPDIVHWSRPSYLGDLIYPTTSDTANMAIQYSGQYYVTVTDNLNCTNSYLDDTTAYQVLGPVFQSVLDVNNYSTGYGVTCPGSSDGSIRIMEDVSSTGKEPFKYWLIHNYTDTLGSGTLVTKGTISTVTGLPAGTYKLSIRDANGCYNMNPPEIDISAPAVISVQFAESKYNGFNVSCKNENNGHVWISSISGGNPGGFTYKWFNYEGKLAGKPDSLNRLDSIPAGTYYLRTRDLYCEKWDSVTLTEPAGMSMPAYKLSFTPDSLYNVSCAGGNNGSIDITVTGGTLPYNYFWTDSASYSATTQVISSLKAGTYVCKITDANGCILKLPPLSKLPSFALTEPPALNIASVVSNSAFGGFNINCNGNNSGSISTTVTGGGGVYQYTWSTTNGSGIVAGQKDQTTLTAGTYHLDVTDLYGCHAVMDSTLTEPAKLSATLVPTQITCAAPLFNNGSIDLTPAGGVTPYSFLWSNGMTTEDITGLTQGNYSVTITDANGCIKTDNVTINLPPPVGYSKTLSDKNGFNISCNGMSDGSIDISPTSGTPPYSYTWTLPDLSTRTTQNISGLKAGDYQLEITDSKLCQVDSTITLKEPGKLDMTVNLSQSTAGGYSINCAGAKTGSIDITPVNAVGTVKYFWSDGSSSKTRTDIPAGVYTVIITDANYCHADSTVTLTEPDSLKLSFTVSEPWCPDKPDGAIVATVKGGVVGTDYNYKWSDNSTGNSLSNILPGIYSLTVTDMNNCPATKSIDLKAQHESCLVIPNAISPNGDGINDVWHIGYIELYPNAEIMIFNRWGETLWRSARGYPDPWDGTSNGSTLPIDSYHYIIDLHNGRKPIVGNVTIVK